MNLFDLTSKVALATGGNGGIGLGMAKGLVQAGAAVVWPLATPKRRAVEIAEPESCHGWCARPSHASGGSCQLRRSTIIVIFTPIVAPVAARFNRWQPVERRQSRSSRP